MNWIKKKYLNSLFYTMGMGPRSESMFTSLGIKAAKIGVHASVKKGVNEYFAPRRYVIYERAKFLRRIQIEWETVEQFIHQEHALK